MFFKVDPSDVLIDTSTIIQGATWVPLKWVTSHCPDCPCDGPCSCDCCCEDA